MMSMMITLLQFKEGGKTLTEVVISNEIDSMPVTRINDRAFVNHFSLKSVIMPDSIKSMGYWVFYGCSSLESIVISNNLKSIPKYAFYGCYKLENVTVPNSVTIIGECAFSNCKSLKSVNISDGVTTIGNQAFWYCKSLESVIIPESTENISLYAFHGCTNLKEITILNPKCNICQRKDTFNENATIYGYENSTAQEYAEKFDYKFVPLGKVPEYIPTGDLNGDGEFNVADAVLFQKYILGISDTEISDLKNADLYQDNIIDSFDLCLMKKKLVENK